MNMRAKTACSPLSSCLSVADVPSLAQGSSSRTELIEVAKTSLFHGTVIERAPYANKQFKPCHFREPRISSIPVPSWLGASSSVLPFSSTKD